MIAALLIGRKGSAGFPGKNIYPILGRPLAYYPMRAALAAALVDKVFISTDCPDLMKLAQKNKVEVIERPEHLAGPKALGEHVFVHGYEEIRKREGKVDLIALLHCNSATVSATLIDTGITVLRKNKDYDSAVSV